MDPTSINRFVRSLLAQAELVDITFRIRPELSDPNDEMVLEAAIAGTADYIVTHNKRDFSGAERHGFKVVTPHEMLRILGLI